MFTSERLTEGDIYTRKDLCDKFDIKDATINTGIFQPSESHSIWLFVNEKKDTSHYKNLLHENTLDWDGQSLGKKDQLIITHKRENLEILVFYRKDKNTFPDYGFKFEGKFQYVSHTGSKPTHFILQRVNEVQTTIEKAIQPHIKEAPIIYELALETNELNSNLEDVVLGDSGRRARTVSWSSTKKISRADLQKAKESADKIGIRGEQYIYQYLQKLKAKGRIREFEWTANENAISPYDFWINDGITTTLIDVKSTQGDFERILHISLNELLKMREGPEKYAIYRVFNIKEATAQLRIVEDLGTWANEILQVFDGLPQGISSDSISLSPAVLCFSPTIGLEIEDWTEE